MISSHTLATSGTNRRAGGKTGGKRVKPTPTLRVPRAFPTINIKALNLQREAGAPRTPASVGVLAGQVLLWNAYEPGRSSFPYDCGQESYFAEEYAARL